MRFRKKYIILAIFIINIPLWSSSENRYQKWFAIVSMEDIRFKVEEKRAYENLVSAGSDAAPYLISQLGRSNPKIHDKAMEILINIDKNAVPYLIESLSDTSNKVSSSAAELLGEIGDKRAVPSLKLAAMHGNEDLKSNSCWALGQINNKTSTAILVGALNDQSSYVRLSAAYALGNLKSINSIEPLFKLLSDVNYSVRLAAFDALSRMPYKQIAEISTNRIEISEPPEKYFLIVLVGTCDSDNSLNTLEPLLQSTDQFIRGFTCEALSYRRGNYRAANLLKKALWDSSPFVRMKARNSLFKIKQGQTVK